MKLVTVSRLRHIAEQRRELVDFRAHAALDLDGVVEGKELGVVGFLAAPREMAFDAEACGAARDRLGHLEQQRVCALAEADDEDPVSRLGRLERRDQHDERMRGPGLAALGVEVVAHRCVGDAGRSCDGVRDASAARLAYRKS